MILEIDMWVISTMRKKKIKHDILRGCLQIVFRTLYSFQEKSHFSRNVLRIIKMAPRHQRKLYIYWFNILKLGKGSTFKGFHSQIIRNIWEKAKIRLRILESSSFNNKFCQLWAVTIFCFFKFWKAVLLKQHSVKDRTYLFSPTLGKNTLVCLVPWSPVSQ